MYKGNVPLNGRRVFVSVKEFFPLSLGPLERVPNVVGIFTALESLVGLTPIPNLNVTVLLQIECMVITVIEYGKTALINLLFGKVDGRLWHQDGFEPKAVLVKGSSSFGDVAPHSIVVQALKSIFGRQETNNEQNHPYPLISSSCLCYHSMACN
jgi:hypothetical protein